MKRGHVCFGAAVALQLAILGAVPAPKVSAALFGKTVVLRTGPVDPYDIMSGYHVTLDYEIARPRNFRGWSGLKRGARVYAVLVEGKEGVWRVKSFHTEWPDLVPEGCVVIKGRKERPLMFGTARIAYGIESYYIPEVKREEIEAALRRVSRRAKVEVKVGPFGNAKISRLLVGDRAYDY